MKNYLKMIGKVLKEKNIIPKLVSIVLAVGFWAYISSIETGTLKFKVPVSYVNLDQSYTVSKISSKTVFVEVRGNKEKLNNVSIKNLKLHIDLANAEPGVYKTYRIQGQKGEVPEDVEVEFDPPVVRSLVEKKIFKNVRIIPRYSGNVQKGYILGRIRTNPEYVRVSGAAETIASINYVYTENIFVDDRSTTLKDSVSLEKEGDEDVEFGVSKVNVTIPVIAYTNISVYELPLSVKNRKKGYRYVPGRSSIRVSIAAVDGKIPEEGIFSAYIDALDIDFDDSAFQGKTVIEKSAPVHVKGAGSDDENNIVQIAPESIDVEIMKE